MIANGLTRMSGRYLLDTNIAIALFANETEVKDSLSQAEELFVPCIVLGELCFRRIYTLMRLIA